MMYTVYWITGHGKDVVRSNKTLPREEVLDFVDQLFPSRCTGIYPNKQEDLF